MLQLRVLSGKQAGTTWVARHFPVQLGRGSNADLCLQEDGVWDEHARLDFQPQEGIMLTAQGEALATVNDVHVRATVLRNGDLIELGSLKLQFWLSETRQGGMGLRDALSCATIGFVLVLQIALLYWLLSASGGS